MIRPIGYDCANSADGRCVRLIPKHSGLESWRWWRYFYNQFFLPPCRVSTSSKWLARGGRRSRCVHFCAMHSQCLPKTVLTVDYDFGKIPRCKYIKYPHTMSPIYYDAKLTQIHTLILHMGKRWNTVKHAFSPRAQDSHSFRTRSNRWIIRKSNIGLVTSTPENRVRTRINDSDRGSRDDWNESNIMESGATYTTVWCSGDRHLKHLCAVQPVSHLLQLQPVCACTMQTYYLKEYYTRERDETPRSIH